MKIETKNTDVKSERVRKNTRGNDIKTFCRHDYKNAVQVGNVDYMCPLCENLLDPMEWFFMNSFEFVEVSAENKKMAKSDSIIAGKARKDLEKKSGKKVSTKNNYLQKPEDKKRLQ